MNRSAFCSFFKKFIYSAYFILISSILSSQVPTITSFSPASGPVGTTVTITGTYFDVTPANNIVWFGAVRAAVTAAAATELTVTVPTGATYMPVSVTVNGLTAYSSMPFTVTFPGSWFIDATAFTPKVDFTTGTDPHGGAVGDIDGDGKPDLAVVNSGDDFISVFRNISSPGSITAGSFDTKVDFPSGSNPHGIAVGDIDGDGKPDIVVANYGNNSVSVFRNTGISGSINSGSFAARVDFAAGLNPYYVAIGDIDGDGKPDLVVTNYNSNTVSVFRNTSTYGSITASSFAPKVDVVTGLQPYFAAIGDIDVDGKLDLVVTNYNSHSFSLFRNNSSSGVITSGSFDPRVDIITGNRPYGLAIGDLDADSRPEISVVSTDNAIVSVFRNTSTSGSISSDSFAPKVDFATGTAPYSVVISDINGDGQPDLVVENYGENTVSVFKNSCIPGSIGAGSFAGKVSFAGGGSFDMAVGDMDGDGKPDLVVTNISNKTVSVLHNEIAERVPPVITSFTPTTGPIGTAVNITGTNFDLTPENNIVWFGAVQATVTSATTTQLMVTVPTGATYQPITVTVNGLTGYSSTPYIVTIPGIDILGATSFASKIDFNTGSASFGVAIGDIDMDGKPDIAIANWGTNNVSVYRNISSSGSITEGSFATKVDFTTGSSPHDIAIGDIDGDGKPDLVVTNMWSYSVSVFRNTSTPGTITTSSFASRVDFPAGGARGIAIGDIDGDGKSDLALTSYTNVVSVFRNTSVAGTIDASSFCSKVDFTTGLYPERVVIGDLDGDGKPDMAVVGSNNTVSIFRNTGVLGYITTGSFADRVDFTTSNSYGVAIGDLDGDGKPDMVVTNNTAMISVFRNTSTSGSITSASFAAKVDFGTGSGLHFVAISDIDGDGNPDIIGTNATNNTVSVFRNTSTSGSITVSSFATRFDFATGTQPYDVAIGDLDGDGKSDMVVTNFVSGTVSVLQNKISEILLPVITSFTPTSGPVGTSVTITGTNFSTTTVNNIVRFGAVQATVTAASATELTVTVPAGATYQPITVTVKGMTAYSGAPFIVTFANPKSIDSESFNAKVDFAAGANPENIAIGDIDGDGKSDLIVTNISSNTVSVFRNTAIRGFVTSGSFGTKVDFVTGSMPKSVAVGDIDGDGKPDLVVANSDGNTISVFINKCTPGSIASGSFNSRVDFNTGTNPSDVAITDIDRDGKSDIIVANYGSNTVSVLRNTSIPGYFNTDSFASKVDFATIMAPKCVITGDIDGDNKPDLAVTRSSDSSISLFRNISIPGSITIGSFDSRVDITAGLNPTSIAFGDIDMDGKPEISVVNSGANTVSVFMNNSTPGSITPGSLTPHIQFATGANPKSIAIGDINGDIKPDLAVVNNSGNSVSVLMNTSTPGSITTSSFASKIDFSTGTGPLDIVTGDIDGDGKTDLSVINNGGSSISVIRNRISDPYPPVITSFTPASGPVGMTVTITGTNFDTTPANNIVWFGAVKATVTSASATELKVIVPAGTSYQPITVTVNGLTAFSGSPFNIIFSSSRIIDAAMLSTKVDFPAGMSPFNAAVSDLDGDGRPDMAVTCEGSNIISIFRNISTSGSVDAGSFAPKVDLTTGMTPKCIAAGDLDGDGKPDLVVTNQGGNTVSVFRNLSTSGSITSGSFAAKVDYTTGTAPYSVYIADMDLDGRPDLVVTNYTDGTISVLKNTCISGSIDAGSFAPKVDFTTGTNPYFAAIGDIDGDGKPDITVANFNSATVSVFRNTTTPGSFGADSFAGRFDLATGTGTICVAIADIDVDGEPDLAVLNNHGSVLSIFRNTSTSGIIDAGSFAAKVDFTTGANPYHVSIGDLDGDGKPDLAVTNPTYNSVSLFRNTSTTGSVTTGSLAARFEFSTWTSPFTSTIGDIDCDGKPDILVVNSGSNVVSVIRNRIPEPWSPVITSFSPASGPVGTTVVITGNYFNPVPGMNIVWFGAVQATVDGGTSTQLTVTVPAGASYQPVTVTKKGLTAASRAPFVVTFPSILTIDTTAFNERVNFTTGTNPSSAAVGDIDGDGKPDIIVTNYVSNSVSVYRNTSSSGSMTAGSFAPRMDFPSGSNPNRIAIGDIDGDGKPDMVVTNKSDNTVSVFRNTSFSGSVSFDAKVDFATGANPFDVAIGDIDRDGKPDLAVTNYADNTVSVLRNTGIPDIIYAGSFAAKIDFATGINPYSVVFGDFNLDSYLDMVVTNGSDNTITAFRNVSTPGSITAGTFSEKSIFATGDKPFDAAVGDIDSDGRPDLVVTNYTSNTVSVFRNKSSYGNMPADWFETKVDFTAASAPCSVAVGDINGDGKPDLAIADYDSKYISIYRNKSIPGTVTSQSFSPYVGVTPGASPSSVVLSDLDGDSRPDMVVTSSASNTALVLRNTLPVPVPPVITSFTPASGAIGTTVTINGSGFSTSLAENIVWFGPVMASVTSATASQLTVTVPAGAAYHTITVTVNGLTAYSNTPFIITFPGTHVIDGYSFTEKINLTTGPNPNAAAVADIDGDGKPDLFVANTSGNSFSAYRNISTSGSISAGSFEPRLDFITGMNPYCIKMGDLDGDGKQDIIVANGSESSISIYRNTGATGSFSSGSFDARIDLPAGNNPHDIAIGDIDGDGKPDLLVSNFNSNNVTIYRNISIPGSLTAGSFAPRVDFTAELYLQDIVLADIDGDKRPDLIAPNFYSGTVSVYRNISVMGSITAGSFAAKVEFTTGTNPLGIAAGDIDGDGRPEMIVSSNSVTDVSVFHNISTPGSITSGSFDPRIDFNSGGGYVAIGDINGDAKPDLIFKNGNSSVSVLKNTSTTGSIGTDSFASGIQFWASGGTSEIIVGDLDCDGKPDLVYMDGASNLVSIMRNRISEPIPPTITSFTPLQGIAGTVVTIYGSNFSTTLAENTVMFGTVQATVTAATAAQLTVTVPTGAATQLISVTVNGLTAYTGTSFIVIVPPEITSFTPASGPVGTTVTIDGANFNPVPAGNTVLFGTTQVWAISATATQLTVIVPGGATTQFISVTVNGLTTISGTSFIVTAPPSDPPVISSFNPASGPVGTTVTINGSNFSTNISNNIVKFGTVQASVISATATQLTVIVPAGATSQPIYLTIDAVTAYSSTSFIVTAAPVITSFNPSSGPVGTTVTIEGTYFGTAPADNTVLFGTVQASVISVTVTQLTVIVPAGAITQPITVTVNGLTTISVTSFTVTAPPPDPPVISSFSPTSGMVGTTVTIDGSNFSTNILNNIVKFGSVQAVVTAATTTQLTVIVPAGATSQPIYVTVDAITAYTSTSFIVTSPPGITSFNPSSGPVGTTVTIDGTNFSTVPAENLVLIGTMQATVTSATPTQLTVIVPIAPPGPATVPIYVTVNGLTATSITYFTVTAPPVIMSFNPASGTIGTTVTITGANFSTNISNNIVRFGTAQAAVISATETQLTVIVPAEAMTGTISLTVNNLTAYSGTSFTVTHTPVIAFFNPTSGPSGTAVTIDGAYFGNSTTDNIVKFGGVEASITSATSTQLVVIVPVRDPGQMNLSVTVNGLTTNSGSAFTITTLPPIINSFTPSSGPVGTSVSISGSNFSPNGSDNIVRFGVLQANIISVTETQLVVTVPNGASNGPISVTVNNQTANSSSPFMVTLPPVVTGINPSSGPVGTTVTINGSNFSQEQSNNVVRFGDIQANVISSMPNQLTVIVPDGADGLEIIVDISGYIINTGVYFAITQPEGLELESSILTLNGDGINEHFVVKNFQIYGTSKLYVYNSRGALAYWNTDFQGEWDVTLHNRRFDTGGYFYVIETSIGTFRGSFSILK